MNIEAKIQELSNLFREIKLTQSQLAKTKLIKDLRILAQQTLKYMEKNESFNNNSRRKQIEEVLKKCDTIQAQMGPQKKGVQIQQSNLKQSSLADMAVRSVVLQEIKASQLKVSPAEFEQLCKKMHKNKEIMGVINEIIDQQGEDIEKIDEQIQKTYSQVQEANKELDEALVQKNKTRRLKFKLTVGSIVTVLGAKFMNLPGLIKDFFLGV